MNVIDYSTLAEEWLTHVVRQYKMTHVCAKDLRLIEYLLKEGFTLIARRDGSKVLRVDFLGKKCQGRKQLQGSRTFGVRK